MPAIPPSARFLPFCSNRKALTRTEDTIAYQYDAANRLTQVGGVSYTWDDIPTRSVGRNLLNDGLFTYTWNASGRLVMAQSISHTVVYTYNGDGVRVGQRVGESAIIYVQDVVAGLPQVLVEIAQQPNHPTTYLYGLGRLAQFQDNAFEWFLDDALGSVRQMAAGDGSILLAQEYNPYGQRLDVAGGGSSGYGYAGEQWDGSTGLVLLRARYYAPDEGRFLSVDPFPGLQIRPSSLHPYLYVSNNPTNFSDSSGKYPPLPNPPQGSPYGPSSQPTRDICQTWSQTGYFRDLCNRAYQLGDLDAMETIYR